MSYIEDHYKAMTRFLSSACLLLTTSMALAQEPIPTDVCKYERAKGKLERIKDSAPYTFDFSTGPHPLMIRPGTEVWVFWMKGSWACVAGGVQAKQGPVLKAGWIEAPKLEPIAK